MTDELDECFTRAEKDGRVKVIVLRGNGDHFSSGHDLGTTEYVGGPARACVRWKGVEE
jgi:enoyl-CoA hydratase